MTITRVTSRGNQLQVVLRCHGSAPCRFRLQGRSGNRVMLSSQATIRGEPQRDDHAHADPQRSRRSPRNRRTAKLLVLSTWNGVTATVSATI